MSTYSQFFSTNPGNLFEDPQRTIWNVAHESYAGIPYSFLSGAGSRADLRAFTTDDFHTVMGNLGDTGSVTSDDSYATITNVTDGSGVITHLVLPGVTNASDTVTAKLTIDGVEWTVAFQAGNATDRFFSGGCFQGNNDAYWGMHDSDFYGAEFVSGLAKRWVSKAGGASGSRSYFYMHDPTLNASRYPCIRFKSSLKVEMKVSDYTTTNHRDDCAVIYILDQ